MRNKPIKPLSDEDLVFASRVLNYHVRMYVETLLWLIDHYPSIKDWDLEWNAIEESHLVNVRVLIQFICFPEPKKDNDVQASFYLRNIPIDFHPLYEVDILKYASEIGGRLVHLTTNNEHLLKSEQLWYIKEIAEKLTFDLHQFLNVVPKNKLAAGVVEQCLDQLSRIQIQAIPKTVSSST